MSLWRGMKKSISVLKKSFDGRRKILRVLEIMNILDRNINGVSIRKLADQFKVSVRSIQRDLNEIEMIGYDLNREIRGMAKFKEGIGLKKRDLPEKMKSSLNLIKTLARSIGGDIEREISQMIDAMLQDKIKNREEIMLIAPKIIKDSNVSFIDDIKEAISFGHVLNIKYMSPRLNEMQEFDICPLKIIYYEGFLYVLAFLYNRENSYRTYRLDRIKELEHKRDKVFSFPENLEEILKTHNIWGVAKKKNIKVELNISGWALDYFKTFDIMSDRVERNNSDGSLTLKGKIGNFNEIIPYILRFMPFVKVVKPIELDMEVRKLLKEYIK
jgi:predicted DNA-binding transcriptional regulator YafY